MNSEPLDHNAPAQPVFKHLVLLITVKPFQGVFGYTNLKFVVLVFTHF